MMPTGMYSWQTIGKTQIILQIHTMMIQTTATIQKKILVM